MSITTTATMSLSVIETLSNTNLKSDDNTVTHGNTRRVVKSGLTAGSSQPCTQIYDAEVTLSSGSATIDFTSLAGTEGTFSASGLKLQFLWLRNKSTNANSITVAIGASNGYTGLGASFSQTLPVGAGYMFDGNEATADVSGSVKTLDVSGTGSQVLEVVAVFG